MNCPISVVILTHNERRNIGDCLDSLVGISDVSVLDSGSTDGTVEYVESRGVTVHHNAFLGFGQQRNFAIDRIPSKFDWQFHLDADERLTPELIGELC